mgnify:CR=1 FL=1
MGVEFYLPAAVIVYEEYVVDIHVPVDDFVCMFVVFCVKYDCVFNVVDPNFGEYA